MTYMNCARCGLTVRLRAEQLEWDACPRCLGRAGLSVPMYITGRRASASRFAETSPGAADVALQELRRA